MNEPIKAKGYALRAAFYVQDGKWLRIVGCDENDFHCEDEDTLEYYEIPYADVNFETDQFFKLTRITE